MTYIQQQQATPSQERSSSLSSVQYTRSEAYRVHAQDDTIQILRKEQWINGYFRVWVVATADGTVVIEHVMAGDATWQIGATEPWTVAAAGQAEQIILEIPTYQVVSEHLAYQITATGALGLMIEYMPNNRQ